jgi:plastocyanin
MSQTLRGSIQSPGRGAEVVVTAVTVAVAVTPASMEQETGARRRRVTIKGLRFMPADVVVAPDHTVRWINRDLFSHNRPGVSTSRSR